MRADNSHHVIAAAQQRGRQTRTRAVAALRRMDATGRPITFEALAREAGVSRSWLYSQDDLRTQIQRHRERRTATTPTPVPERQRATDTSLLHRLEAATDRVRRLETENQQLREALAKALGQRRADGVLGDASARDTPKRTGSKIIGPC